MPNNTPPLGVVPVTESEVEEVLAAIARRRAASDAERALKKRKELEDLKRALHEGRLPWHCGPCRSCVTQILSLTPVDRALCERP